MSEPSAGRPTFLPPSAAMPTEERATVSPWHSAERPARWRRARLVLLPSVLVAALVATVALVAPLIVERLPAGGDRPLAARDASGQGNPGSPSPSAPRTDFASAELRVLLSGRTAALRAKDEKAFLAPFQGAARDVQKRVFRNLMKFSFKVVEYRSVNPRWRPPDATLAGSAAAILSVNFVHQIEGVDLSPVAERYDWTVRRGLMGDPLVVTHVTGSRDRGGAYPAYHPMPWDAYRELSVVRRPHVLVVSAKSGERTTKRMAPILERAAKDDVTFWRRNGLGRATTMPGFLIVLEPERKVFLDMFGAERDGDVVTNKVGFAVSMPAFGTRPARGTSRIAIDSGSWRGSATPDTDALLIARHEIAHALVTPLASRTDPAQPRLWVVEGFAEYMSLHDRPDYQRYSARSLRGWKSGEYALPANEDFYSGDKETNHAHYVLAMLAIRFIAEEQGVQNALAFVAHHYSVPSALDAQLRLVTGWDPREFARKWSTYAKKQVAR